MQRSQYSYTYIYINPLFCMCKVQADFLWWFWYNSESNLLEERTKKNRPHWSLYIYKNKRKAPILESWCFCVLVKILEDVYLYEIFFDIKDCRIKCFLLESKFFKDTEKEGKTVFALKVKSFSHIILIFFEGLSQVHKKNMKWTPP